MASKPPPDNSLINIVERCVCVGTWEEANRQTTGRYQTGFWGCFNKDPDSHQTMMVLERKSLMNESVLDEDPGWTEGCYCCCILGDHHHHHPDASESTCPEGCPCPWNFAGTMVVPTQTLRTPKWTRVTNNMANYIILFVYLFVFEGRVGNLENKHEQGEIILNPESRCRLHRWLWH